MESSVASDFAKTSQALADKTVRKVQDGVDTAKDAGGALSSKADSLRREAGPALTKGSDRVQSTTKRGLDALTDLATEARDFASDASDSIVSFTKGNPVKSLALAAASGALIYAAYKAVRSSRR